MLLRGAVLTVEGSPVRPPKARRGGLDWWRVWRWWWEAWHHTRELRQWTLVPPAAAALTGALNQCVQ
jgi:hypothetical protein